MSFSEDPSAEPNSLGGVSDIFEVPDVVWHSPTTTERIVDTQSGFQVVIKQLDMRNSLSVKRRIGTPPSSSILLTPDESLKLSKILNGASPVEETGFNSHKDAFLSKFAGDDNSQKVGPVFGKLKNILTINTITVLLVGVFLGFLVEDFVFSHHAKLEQAKDVSQTQIEYFAKNFVTELLDFSPSSYKISQIRAMSNMTPELVESYWKDTNFPLNKQQIASLSQNSTLNIISIKQSKIDNKTTDVEVIVKLTDNKNNKSSSVHLQLKIEQDAHKQLYIAKLKDLSDSH